MADTPPTLLAANANILKEASHMATIPQFLHLLQHAKLLIQTYGPYTTQQKSTVFIRGQNGNQGTQKPSPNLLAASLAAAQDCSDNIQPLRAAKDDLFFFHELWCATIAVLEAILDARTLSTNALGWGLLGLCSGYTTPPGDSDFVLHKLRLQNVLPFLSSVGQPSGNWNEYRDQMRSCKRRVQVLTNIQPEANFCTTMLVQRFRAEGWARIRWWQAVAVAERWVGHLGLGEVIEDCGKDVKECPF